MGIEARKLFIRRKQEFIGRELEEHYLGFPVDWEQILAKNKINPENLTRQDWLKIFKEHYPLDPKMPEKKWGKDLFNFVAEELRIDPENPQELDFFNSLGSKLDRAGIDCFFLFKNPNTKKEVIFSIDLTAEEKKDEWKADAVLKEFPDYRSQEDEYIEKMKETAKQIAKRLIEKSGPIR
jgi:hypothetical protein